jgi:cytochrome P450
MTTDTYTSNDTVCPAREHPRFAASECSVLDPSRPGFHDDPSANLAVLREAGPLHWSDAISSWVVTRYEDVRRLARSRDLAASITTLVARPDGSTDPQPGYRMMINRDGADHIRLRRLVSRAFTPRAIDAWAARASSVVDRLLEAAAERDEIDVIGDYAFRLPAQVITEMLGLPTEDTPQLRSWSRSLTVSLEPTRSAIDDVAIRAAGEAFTDYLLAAIADKRSRMAADILSDLLRAEESGEGLSDRDVVAQILLLYIAGHETTLNLIGNGVVHLFRSPDQLARLRADQALDVISVEEILRYEAPTPFTRRVAVEPVEVGGTILPAGSHLTLSLASANRDRRKWGPTADVLDIGRPDANEHVSFGGGPHHCLGAALARLEGRIALPRLLRRFPAMAPAYEKPNWMPRLSLRGVSTLPVTLRA